MKMYHICYIRIIMRNSLKVCIQFEHILGKCIHLRLLKLSHSTLNLPQEVFTRNIDHHNLTPYLKPTSL